MCASIVRREVLCKSILSKTGIRGFDYCINPYTGCSHGCHYCYASFMSRFSNHREKWGYFVDIKINAAYILSKQLKSRKKPGGKVLIGTVTDAYQPDEARYKVTRSILELLADYQMLEVHILTKSALVKRDISIQSAEYVNRVFHNHNEPQIARILERRLTAANAHICSKRTGKGRHTRMGFYITCTAGDNRHEEALSSLLYPSRIRINEIMTDFLNPYSGVVRRLKYIPPLPSRCGSCA